MRVRRALVVVAVLIVALACGTRPVGADCAPEKNAPNVLFLDRATNAFDPGKERLFADHLLQRLRDRSAPVTWTGVRELQDLLALQTTRAALTGSTPNYDDFVGALGARFVFDVTFDQRQENGARTVSATLLDTRAKTDVPGRAFRISLPSDDGLALDAIEAAAPPEAANLLCDLLGRREHPVVPLLTLDVSPKNVQPGGTVHVTVTLADADDPSVPPPPGKQIRISNRHGSVELRSGSLHLDPAGFAAEDVGVGSAPGSGTIEATYRSEDGRSATSIPVAAEYRVLDTRGDLQTTAPDVALQLGAGETVTARLLHGGAPVAGASIAFAAAGGGGLTDPFVVTDADGLASTQFQAPGVNAVVDVTATAPAQPAKGPKTVGPDLTASLTFVVDGGVTLNLNALDTAAGGTSDVTADLVVGGTAIPGADVTFTLTGAGALSAPSAPTDDAGRAEVTWVAPAGNSSATITATTVVDGQTYTESVTVHAGPVGGIGVKVHATMPGIAWHTFAEIADHNPVLDITPCSVATLAGVQACSGGGVVVDYGTGSVDAPLTLRTGPGAGNISNEMTVTRPDPNVVVVEFSVATANSGTYIQDSVCLELAFDTAGSLTIDADGASMTGGLIDPRVDRPKDGSTFTVGGGYLEDDFRGFYGTMTTESIDVAQRETFQLSVHLNAERYTGTPPDGTYKFTLTFHPQ